MPSTDIVDSFTATREALESAGLNDEFFLDLLASRLLVERIGESSNQDWWDSRVLSETGRVRLSEVTPKTQLQSRIDLASEVGRKAESDRIPADSISLYSFGPQMESRLNAAIEEIDAGKDITLEALENLSIQSLDEGWTDAIIPETTSKFSGTSGSLQNPGSGESFVIDEDGCTQADIETNKRELLATLLEGYGYCTDRLRVPYYPLMSEMKSENV